MSDGFEMTGTSDLAIEISGLGKRFGDVEALSSLDLEVPRGSVFGFLGPNGSGKTTAMRILLGLARPTSGRASVLGFDVVRDSLEIRRRVGYLAQLPRFYEELTPVQTLRFSLGFFPLDAGAHIEQDIAEALELVGLESKASHAVGGLSGGQRQRLGIAQAYVHRPELLILDEPAAALDPIGRRDVLEIMRRLKGTTTIFYSTHILDDVERVSDTVAVLDQGRRVAQSPIGLLLAGGEASYVVEIRGDSEEAVRRVGARSWVRAVAPEPVEDRVRLRVLVDDPEAAEEQLLRCLLDIEGLRVVSYAAHRLELEDAFMQLVGEVSA